MGRQLGTAVVGTGYIGSKHAHIYSNLPNSRLIAVIDENVERAKNIAAELGCRAEYDYRTILDDSRIDAVSICLPEDNHVKPVLEFAQQGKHVLLEKPMAMTSNECEEIINSIKANNIKFMVGHLLHFDPKYIQAKEKIDKGDIGEIVHIVMQRNGIISAGRNIGAKKSISVLHHVGVHDYELALWFSQAKLNRVYGEYCDRVLGKQGKTQDSFWGLLRFKDGSFASVGSSWVLDDKSGADVSARMEILGTKGLVEINCGICGSLRMFSEKGWEFPDVYHWPVMNDHIGGALNEQLNHFLRCIINDENPKVNIENTHMAVKVVEDLLESAQKGVPIYY